MILIMTGDYHRGRRVVIRHDQHHHRRPSLLDLPLGSAGDAGDA